MLIILSLTLLFYIFNSLTTHPFIGRHVPGIAANRRASSYDSDPNQDYPPRRGYGNNNNNLGGGYDSEGSVDSRNGGGRGGKGQARGRGRYTIFCFKCILAMSLYCLVCLSRIRAHLF